VSASEKQVAQFALAIPPSDVTVFRRDGFDPLVRRSS
jgi:hypothetical protein